MALAALAFTVLLVEVPLACRKPGARTGKTAGESAPPGFFTVTGYCNCGKCCSWEPRWIWFGDAVHSSGKMKGLRKEVGKTASGTIAKKGTVAADPKVFPFGTVLEIPGYGKGIVEDTGGSIKGRHIDVWFATHDEAKKWGVRKLKVKVLAAPKKGKSPQKTGGEKNERNKK